METITVPVCLWLLRQLLFRYFWSPECAAGQLVQLYPRAWRQFPL